MNHAMSLHAFERCQQRAIPPLAIELLERFGRVEYHNGCEVFSFDKRSRRQLEHYAGRELAKHLLKLTNAYVVEGHDTVVTVGHRQQRFRRKR